MASRVEGTVLRRGEHVELLALSPDLYEPLYRALMVPEVANTWRPRGQYVPLAGWERFLSEGMEFAAVARNPETHELIGLVELRDVEHTDGYGYVSAAASADAVGSGLIVEAVTIFIDEAFARSQLYKVYLLLSESSRAALQGTLAEMLDVEGVLRGHVMLLGQRQDVTVASITRERFAQRVSQIPLLRSLARDAGWRLAPDAGPQGGRAVRDVLAGVADACGVAFDSTTKLADLATDSLAVLELLTAVEDEIGREVTHDFILSMGTVDDLLRWVESAR